MQYLSRNRSKNRKKKRCGKWGTPNDDFYIADLQ
jgi:hypothetical protein